jgi:hypothetical protein
MPFASHVLPFAFTSFLSAFLLFQVQLIVNKHILPWFGGSAAVWTTSLVVFQLLLLAGYVYSHLLTTRLPFSRQFLLHGIFLSVAMLVVVVLSLLWPSAVTPSPAWKPSQGQHPALSVCFVILISTGLPFFALSATAPLLQSWFSRLGYGSRAYRLYAVSNLGSLSGLLVFPFVLEPIFGLTIQGRAWALLFCIFAVACLLCGREAGKSGARESHDHDQIPQDSAPITRVNYVLWFLLAMCASALLLATTNMLCEEVITVPLLWVLPLSIYLVTFIVCFDHPRWYQRSVIHPLFMLALFLTCVVLHLTQSQIFLARLLFPLLLLFATCMICHGELVRLKPGVRHLTAFYLAVSGGGAAGGIFVALVAPHLFASFVEFELTLGFAVVLLLVSLFRDRSSWLFSGNFLLPAVVVAATMAIAYAVGTWLPEVGTLLNTIRFYPVVLLTGVVVIMGALVVDRSAAPGGSSFRFVQILAGVLAVASLVTLYYSAQPRPGLVSSTRNFYGVVRVFRQGNVKLLLHGQTTHGAQFDPPDQRVPVTYYSPESGIGLLLRNHPKRSSWSSRLRIGVVGLGTGTIATYGLPGDTIRFYELDPDVIKLTSGEAPAFTYLRDSRASVTTVLGDARLALEREAAEGKSRQFDVLVLDAFSGDAIPVHLLTKEAFETYWNQLESEKGIIAVHITSRHVNLVPVLLGAAEHFHARSFMTLSRGGGPYFDSGWFLMSKDPESLNIPGLERITVQYVYKVGPRLWTDDKNDVFRLMY